MQADPDLLLEVKLLLQILRVCSSHLVSSAAHVPEAPGRYEYQEDDWPQVLLPFIFVKVVSGCVKIVSSPCLWEEGGCDLKEPSCRYCQEQLSTNTSMGAAPNSYVLVHCWCAV